MSGDKPVFFGEYSVGTAFELTDTEKPDVAAGRFFMVFAKADEGGFLGFLRCEDVQIHDVDGKTVHSIHLVVEKVQKGFRLR